VTNAGPPNAEQPDYVQPDYSLLGEDHVKAYRESNGEVGYLWNGAKTLLLTTTGRRTGQPRTAPLIYEADGDRYIVIASKGGAPEHPRWYTNLLAHATAEVQVKADRVKVTATTAEGDERTRLWALVNEQWPNYDVYQTRTDRVIPVVILTCA
jgi:deazaflavin-dependent oxidoreductase (nitroreductase family)